MRRVVFATLLALAVAGCGDEAQPDARSVVAGASARLESTGTLQFSMRSRTERLSCDGAVDYVLRGVRMDCEYDGERLAVITLGRDEYVRPRGEAKWTRTSGDGGTAFAFPDPRAFLAGLRKGTISSERVGREDVRGIETSRFRVVVDPKKTGLADDSEPQGPTTLDLWIDGEDLLRRIATKNPDEGEFSMEFFAFGEPVDVHAPPADEIESH